jgi:hypothetical protein
MLSAPGLHVTDPEHNNLHAFRCTDPDGCAFLDIFSPPYDFTGAPCNRPCEYYVLAGEVSMWELQPGNKYDLRVNYSNPFDVEFDIGEYNGPNLVIDAELR